MVSQPRSLCIVLLMHSHFQLTHQQLNARQTSCSSRYVRAVLTSEFAEHALRNGKHLSMQLYALNGLLPCMCSNANLCKVMLPQQATVNTHCWSSGCRRRCNCMSLSMTRNLPWRIAGECASHISSTACRCQPLLLLLPPKLLRIVDHLVGLRLSQGAGRLLPHITGYVHGCLHLP